MKAFLRVLLAYCLAHPKECTSELQRYVNFLVNLMRKGGAP